MAARRPALKMSEPSRPAHTFILLQWLQAEATKKLIDAARSGDLMQVAVLFALGADIETRDEVSAAEGYWCPSLFSSTSYLPPPQPDPLLASARTKTLTPRCLPPQPSPLFHASLLAVLALCSPFHQDGCTALYIASHGGQLDVVKYLVEHGADVNAAREVSPSRGRRAPSSAREDCTPPLARLLTCGALPCARLSIRTATRPSTSPRRTATSRLSSTWWSTAQMSTPLPR